MNVQKLNHFIGIFKKQLAAKKLEELGPHWESLGHFQGKWDIDAPDIAEMYKHSLQNSQTKRMWKREAWEPKEMMIRFMKMQPEFVRKMFKDLFDESKDISGRISRFKFGMDAMLAEYKERNPVKIDNNHYHDDSQMIHLYLAFRFPEKYCLFHYPSYRNMTELLLMKDPPSPFETERFFKITKIWKTFLGKEEEIQTLVKEEYLGFLVFDFYGVA